MGKDRFLAQSIQKCIEISDIHLFNPNDPTGSLNALKKKVARYVALILHPGLVTPSLNERCMQIAYNARVNSGCISRQVGAVVTDGNYVFRGIGWNNPPQGQTPCILRCADRILKKQDESAYSEYELRDEAFNTALQEAFGDLIQLNTQSGRHFPYCFKDVRNAIDGEKNQVHTRSLHAEENAFLMTAKYGGEPLEGGFLFTTASPCELCSKKAYQIGVRRIYYIDPYPGIAEEHILKGGGRKPELELFEGAVGRAYEQLFQPIMPYKDELQLVTGFEITRRPSALELENRAQRDQLERQREELERQSQELERLRAQLQSQAGDTTL